MVEEVDVLPVNLTTVQCYMTSVVYTSSLNELWMRYQIMLLGIQPF